MAYNFHCQEKKIDIFSKQSINNYKRHQNPRKWSNGREPGFKDTENGKRNRRGSLSVGYPADITILELCEGDFLFCDGIPENTLGADRLLEPRATIKNGEVFKAQSRFRNHVPGEPIPLIKGA
jgi:hypothetical protein